MIKKAYKFRFYPTPKQIEQLAHVFGCTRYVYNRSLKIRQEAWYVKHEKIDYHTTSALLTSLKKQPDHRWLNDVSCVPLQQSLRHLNIAFINFWSGRTKYPTFKKLLNKQAAEFTRSAFKWKNDKLTLAKIENTLDIRLSRKFSGLPTTITVSKDPSNRYFVSMLVEEPKQIKPEVKSTIGIDLGITDICVGSDNFKSGAPKYSKKYAKKLKRVQQELSRKKKGSANRTKERLKVAKVHAKISDSRKDFTHKLSTKLINENQVIFVETLAIKNMIKNHKLAKSISDSSWGKLLRQLEYKSNWYGRTLVGIDRWYPSTKRCSVCGYINETLTLSDRTWLCPKCKTNHDRDINAAKNIKAVGQTVLAFGEDVKLVSNISNPR